MFNKESKTCLDTAFSNFWKNTKAKPLPHREGKFCKEVKVFFKRDSKLSEKNQKENTYEK